MLRESLKEMLAHLKSEITTSKKFKMNLNESLVFFFYLKRSYGHWPLPGGGKFEDSLGKFCLLTRV